MLLFSLDVLAEAIYLSVDPYMRPYSERIPVGVTMIGAQIAKYANIIQIDLFQVNESSECF